MEREAATEPQSSGLPSSAPTTEAADSALARPAADRTPSTWAVLGALVRRDLMRDLRKTRAFVLLMAAVGLFSCIVFVGWPDESFTLSFAARASEELLMVFTAFYLATACIVLPAYGAMAIVQEREQDTLDLLDLTLMPRWALLTGKLLNTLGFYLLLVVAGLPPLSLIFGLVGLDLSVFLKALIILVPAALSVAMLSILCSARARRGIVALLISFLAMLCAMGAWLIPVMWTLAVMDHFLDLGMSFSFMEEMAAIVSPPVALVYIANSMGRSYCFIHCALFQCALFTVAFLAAWALLRRPLEARTPRWTCSRKRPLTRTLDILFARVPPFVPIADRANPAYRAEVQWSPLTRPSGRRRLFLLLALVFIPVVPLFHLLLSLEPEDDGVMVWVFVHLTLASLLSPIMSANTLTRENELGNLDMLRMTLLRPRDIVWGKMRAAFMGIRSSLAITLLSSLVILPVVRGIPRGCAILVTGVCTVTVCAALMVCFGMLASAAVKRSTAAAVLAYGSALTYIYLVLPGWWGAVELVRDIAREFGVHISRPDGGLVAEALEGLSPVYAFWELFDDADQRAVLMSQWIASMAANGLLCFLLVVLAVWFFERRHMKEK